MNDWIKHLVADFFTPGAFMDWIKRLVADVDGHPDEARFALLLGCLAVIGFTAWNMYLDRPFNPSEFALGYGGVVGAFGAALWARGKN